MSQKFCNWCSQFASSSGQSEGGGQILIDNETGHKKEKKASKSATILRRKVTNGILRTKELGDKGNISKIAPSGSKSMAIFPQN